MNRIYSLSFLVFLMSCACFQKTGKTTVEEPPINIANLLEQNGYIYDFLGHKNGIILENHTDIDVYKIVPHKIEGTEEYSNKAEKLKTLSRKETNSFLTALLDDRLYQWDSVDISNGKFSPRYQFRIKDSLSSVSIMFSPETNQISCITLFQGQQTVKVEPELENRLYAILEEE